MVKNGLGKVVFASKNRFQLKNTSKIGQMHILMTILAKTYFCRQKLFFPVRFLPFLLMPSGQ